MWNDSEIRVRFGKRAAELDARLPSLRRRAVEGAAVRALHDESLAKLLVYRTLVERTVLSSREEMLNTLAALRRDPPPAVEAMEPANFSELLRQFVDALVGQYRG